MSKNIGFLIPNLEHNPFQDKIMDLAININKRNTLNETLIFSSSCTRSDIGQIPVMHIINAKFFDGILFVFDLPSILISQSFYNLQKKYFYTFQTVWSPDSKYNIVSSLIKDDSLEIITSDDHLYNIYDMCWKKPLSTVEITNYEKLLSII